jgi:hypothetical protein
MAFTNLKLKTEFDAQDKAAYKSACSETVAAQLLAAAETAKSRVAIAYHSRMVSCSSLKNVWVGRDLHSETGECFDGYGSLFSCNSIFCQHCAAARRRKVRRRMLSTIPTIKPDSYTKRWRFVTLTCPTLKGVELVDALHFFQRSFSLLRKRKFWTAKVQAGFKGVEFTTGESSENWTLETDGYHVHIHALLLSDWLAWSELGEEWTQCLEKTAAEFGQTLIFNTSHGRAIVDVREAVEKKKRNTNKVVALNDAVAELTKYLTKAESWLKVSDAELVKIAELERLPRMFEFLAEARNSANTQLSCSDQTKPSDSERKSENVEQIASLDTKCLSDGEPAKRKPLGSLKQSWRELARLLTFDFAKYLGAVVEKTQRIRKMQLAARYPFAVFQTLDGSDFSFAP